MAIASVLPESAHKQRLTSFTVIGVASFSTFAMIFYPVIGDYLGLDDKAMGFFIGAAIHDVAQVVGAGYSVSDSAGDMATLTKLVRVAMLMPVVLIMMIAIKHFYKAKSQADGAQVPKMPMFLVGFIVLMLLNSFVTLPEVVIETGTQISRFFLVVSITAIGMKSNLGKLAEVGMLPIVMIVAETLWIALLILGYLFAI